ncbi:MAG TPA: hypothetical protein PLH43_01785 [Acetivibrio sp.]|nr:hypothetical protein [Acetivibrio sp.]HOM01545.1 hypothetical protein [Acetivibrio sp.]
MKRIFLQFGSGLGPMSRSLPIALALAGAGYEILPNFTMVFLQL